MAEEEKSERKDTEGESSSRRRGAEQPARSAESEDRLAKLEELAALRVKAEQRSLEAEDELARLRRSEEEARLRAQEEIARLRAREDMVVQEARSELARLQDEEEAARMRLGLDMGESSSGRASTRRRARATTYERAPRRERVGVGERRGYDDEPERGLADSADRTIDEVSDLVHGATMAYLEELRSVTEIANSLMNTVYDRAEERDDPEERRARRRTSGTRRRGARLEYESGTPRYRRRRGDTGADLSRDVYSGLMDALYDYADIPRRAVDRFYEHYTEAEPR